MKEFIERDDLVILGNRDEAQQCAIDINASCIVVCQNAKVAFEDAPAEQKNRVL